MFALSLSITPVVGLFGKASAGIVTYRPVGHHPLLPDTPGILIFDERFEV